MAGTTGLEPATSAVTGQRSDQLSYVPRLPLAGNLDLNVTEISNFAVAQASWISPGQSNQTKRSEQTLALGISVSETEACGAWARHLKSLENMAVLADREWSNFHNYTSLPIRPLWHKRAIPVRTRLNFKLVGAAKFPLERPCWIGPNYPIWRQSHC